MSHPRILAFAGSNRRQSFNARILKLAVAAARAAGGEVTELDLREYPLPLFDQDLEQAEGPPPNATKLKKLFVEHTGLMIACPEYNSSITPLLKNTIDWVSRPEPDFPGLIGFKGKFAVLMSASPGALGGLRGLVHVRAILSNIGVNVLADQLAVPRAHEAFDESGKLKDPTQQAMLSAIGTSLAALLAKLA